MTVPPPSPSAPRRVPPWAPPEKPPNRLETARLLLRPYVHDDAVALFGAICGSRETLLPWLPWAATDYKTIHDATYNIERMRRSADGPLTPENNAVYGFVFGMFDRRTGELVGGTGFNRMNPGHHDAECGYWVRADKRRKGYCTEALAGMLMMGFIPQRLGGFGFRRVHIFAAASNEASCKVPGKLGIRQEYHGVKDRWVPGLGFCDTIGWGVLAEEWDPEKWVVRGFAR